MLCFNRLYPPASALASLLFFGWCFTSSIAYAEETEQTAKFKNSSPEMLGKALTPIGAIREGNKGVGIPAWDADKLSFEEHFERVKQVNKDKPLYTINSQNYKAYQSYLSQGLKALIEKYPDSFKINVYPSRRTSKIPDRLYQYAIKNGFEAKIAENGEEVLYAWPGLPFPIPKTAKEVMWNHQLRWKGLFFKLDTKESVVTRTGDYNFIENILEVYSYYHDESRTKNISDWRYIYYLSYIRAPSSLAGGAYLSYESMQPLTKPRQHWIYTAGQRRMRRSPAAGYDAPTFTSDGLRMMDEIDMYNGALNRYDWELVGRKVMLIPYNNESLYQSVEDEENIFLPGHIDPALARYEMHRVWVVEAKVKQGERHLYEKRTFYLDEDSWNIALQDIYNHQNELWRVGVRYSRYFPEVPVTLTAIDVFHDLERRTYYFQALEYADYSNEPPQKGYFAPNAVRMRIKR